MFKLEKYTRPDGGVKDLGSFKEGAAGLKIQFLSKNFADATKRVVLLLSDKDGNSTPVSCSKVVSADIRAGKLTMGQIASLRVLENKEGVKFLSYAGTTTEQLEMDKIEAEEIVRPGISITGLLKGAL